jgi:hypothetical protein
VIRRQVSGIAEMEDYEPPSDLDEEDNDDDAPPKKTKAANDNSNKTR